MEKQIFRKKSVERLTSPEQLNDYLHVTRASTWAVLVSVIILLAAIVIWSAFATIESAAEGTAAVKSGEAIISFLDQDTASNIETGMIATIGEVSTQVTYMGRDADGLIIAGASVPLPDGVYNVKVTYRETQIIKMLID